MLKKRLDQNIYLPHTSVNWMRCQTIFLRCFNVNHFVVAGYIIRLRFHFLYHRFSAIFARQLFIIALYAPMRKPFGSTLATVEIQISALINFFRNKWINISFEKVAVELSELKRRFAAFNRRQFRLIKRKKTLQLIFNQKF